MAIPHRGKTGDSTYFISAQTYLKRHILQSDKMARLFIEVLYHYRKQNKYLIHEFVVMPNHFHLLITPHSEATLERGLQLIKGGFSFRAKKHLGFAGEIWQTSFHDRRVRDENAVWIDNAGLKACATRKQFFRRLGVLPGTWPDPVFQFDPRNHKVVVVR